MNFAKVSMQKRIAQEGFIPSQTWASAPQKAQWIKITFGKHSGKTLPEILASEPCYVIEYLYLGGSIFKALLKEHPSMVEQKWAHQLKVLANRSQNILVPEEKRETHEFVLLKDKQGVFAKVRLMKKGRRLPRRALNGLIEASRTEKLDFSAPYSFHNPQLGLRRMVRSLCKLFFPHDMTTGMGEQFHSLFSNRTNFDLSRFASHTSLIMTERDTSELRAEYKRSLVHH